MPTNAEKMNLLNHFYNAIFDKLDQLDISRTQISHMALANNRATNLATGTGYGTVSGRYFKDSTTGQPTLRGFDADVMADGGKTIQIRCIEQNPNKRDINGNLKQLANLARQGHRIMWVIDRNQTNGFLGRIQDNEWIPSQERAYGPATPPSQSTYQPQENVALPASEDIPDIPPDIDIPDYVHNMMANMVDEGYDDDDDIDY